MIEIGLLPFIIPDLLAELMWADRQVKYLELQLSKEARGLLLKSDMCEIVEEEKIPTGQRWSPSLGAEKRRSCN